MKYLSLIFILIGSIEVVPESDYTKIYQDENVTIFHHKNIKPTNEEAKFKYRQDLKNYIYWEEVGKYKDKRYKKL